MTWSIPWNALLFPKKPFSKNILQSLLLDLELSLSFSKVSSRIVLFSLRILSNSSFLNKKQLPCRTTQGEWNASDLVNQSAFLLVSFFWPCHLFSVHFWVLLKCRKMIRKYSNMTGTTNRSSTRAHNFCSFFEMIVRIEKRIALHIPEILYLNFLLALNLPIGRTECLGRCVMDLLIDLHIQLIPERPPSGDSTQNSSMFYPLKQPRKRIWGFEFTTKLHLLAVLQLQLLVQWTM